MCTRKMKKKAEHPVGKYVIFIILICIFSGEAQAAFEKNSGGASLRGMGETGTAVAGLLDGIFYNLAGLAMMERTQLDTMAASEYAGLQDDSLYEINVMGAVPFKSGKVFSAGWNSFHSSFYKEDLIILGFSQRLIQMDSWKILAGTGARVMRKGYGVNEYMKVDPLFVSANSKTGFSLDFGSTLIFHQYLSVGVSIQNILAPDLGLVTKSATSRTFRFGVSWYRPKSFFMGKENKKSPVTGLRISMDGVFHDADRDMLTGLEIRLFDVFSVRGGFGFGTASFSQASAGLGYEYVLTGSMKIVGIDYGLVMPLSGVQTGTYGSHFVSIDLKF